MLGKLTLFLGEDTRREIVCLLKKPDRVLFVERGNFGLVARRKTGLPTKET